MTNTLDAGLWPYTSGSSLIDPDLAKRIRSWALTKMSAAELHAHSQRQILHRYITEHVRPTIARIAPQTADPALQAKAAKAAEGFVRENEELTATNLITAIRKLNDE
jgi:hypothetical protein